MNIRIPYGKSFLEVDTNGYVLKGVLCPKAAKGSGEETLLIQDAMDNPIASPSLSELSEGKNRILIITSDHTRPLPSRLILPQMLAEIRKTSPHARIKLLIATGFHRASTEAELRAKLGEVFDQVDIEMHDARKQDEMVFKGILPSGGELWLNHWVDWAELIVSEGFIEPHFFAGFSGGRKSILPGIASQTTVFANHNAEFIASTFARAGVLEGNPLHKDMLWAAACAKLAFIVNVVLDGNKRVIAAFAGNPVEAHAKGCAFVLKHSAVSRAEADIVVAGNGGYPLDQNIYQAVKGMTAAEACVRQGGVIIMCAFCGDGHGGEDFFRWFTQSGSAAELSRRILAIPQTETLPDQWEAQILARVMEHAQVIMVTQESVRNYVRKMGMQSAATIAEALELACELTQGRELTVIPDGVGVIVR